MSVSPSHVRRVSREVVLRRTQDAGFGFSIVGATRGKRTDALKGIYVSKICAGSAADRSHNMAVGDKILSVNDNDLLEATHLEALAMIQGAGDMIKLVLAEDPIGYGKFTMAKPELVDASRSPQPSRATAGAVKRATPPAVAAWDSEVGVGPAAFAPSTAQKAPSARLAPPQHDAIVHANRVSTDPDNEAKHVRMGQGMLEAGDYARAEQHFLEALHTTVDPRLTAGLVDASKHPDPASAQRACRKVIEESQKSKAGVYYLLGLSVAKQKRMQDAQLPFLVAVQQCLPWLYVPGMVIDPADPELHHNVGLALCAQNKFAVGRTAFEEAIRLAPERTAWKEEWDRLTSHTGYTKPLGLGELSSRSS